MGRAGHDDRPRGGVTVRGCGAADAVPDVVVADLATEVRADDVSTALREATAALAAVRTALRDAGVEDRAVRTGTTSTWTEQTGADGDALRVVARLGLAVTLRDVAAAGDVIGSAVTAGGSPVRLGGLRLVVSDPAAAQVRAREAAWQDAAAKAAHLAELAGRTLGAVLRVDEDEPRGAAPLFARSAAADAFTVPVEPGEQTVQAAVTVRWAWAPTPGFEPDAAVR
ncbi:SIMPL domain-containing protein [Cellulomonas dongxiuzhuiae]|uniref:SIMPL domain-containing protein n=1 Tax=Cellulomonas dongxiuzhuiae TaxID=2819979 RepID=A0ABX8GME9_9CELL|nr:SIMPL domain-containing protein [Cellulomonas dongxiuzhuiae]MBO3096468.1 SIMPL domain-containing protein [Cellulomonas dongxiuzhuiae]QWC16867.1 SIMPL domain-containing protein [Cellulomonas dongxiuzhuiae]